MYLRLLQWTISCCGNCSFNAADECICVQHCGIPCRRHMRWMTAAEDMSVLEELEEAEEGYDEPDEVRATSRVRRRREEGGGSVWVGG